MSRILRSCTTRALVALTAAIMIAAPGLAAQGGTITGLVTNTQSGQPLEASQVFIAGLDIGGLSQQNGRYLLQNVPSGTHQLTVERIGYRSLTQQVTVGGGQTVVQNFDMVEQALALDEIIVTGTAGGTQRRAIGNVVERVDAAAIQEIAPVTTVEQMLATRIPGLQMQSSGGTIGGGSAQIRIRGSASVGLSNDPLVYIDGVRMNIERSEGRRQTSSRLNDINPEDIESIEVIKGPAAATLYGTEASNGVIQIITKRGAQGDVQFNATVGLGVNYLDDPSSKVFTSYGSADSSGAVGCLPVGVGDCKLLQMNIVDAELARFGRPMLRHGLLQEYSLSAQGGTDRVRYFASYNRNAQDGFVRWNWEKNQTGRLNLDLTVNDKLTIGLNSSVMSGLTRLAGDFWVQTMRGGPRDAVDYGGQDGRLRGFGSRTPKGHKQQRWMFDTRRQNVSVNVQYAPAPWLQTRLIFGNDHTDQVENITLLREVDAPKGEWRSAGLGVRDVHDVQTTLETLDYSGTVSYAPTGRLGTSTSFGFQYYKKVRWNFSAEGNEFATTGLSTVGAASRVDADEDLIENVTVGFYIQEQLSWEDRFFLTGAVRRDENSAFGVDYGPQTYPKVSATWVISEESFWGLGFLNPLRLRGAWGKAGKQPDTFASTQIYAPVTGTGSAPAVTPANYGNATLGPEKGQELEVGFDAGFWDDRIALGFTQYWKSTQDAIVAAPIRPSLAFPGQQFINAGQIDNWGSEITLDFQVLQENPLRWDVGIAFSSNDNEIITLGDIKRIPIRRGREHVVGFPLAGFHDFKVVSADFVNGSNGLTTNRMCDGGIAHGGGYKSGGPAVDCNNANRVYWGPTSQSWIVSATSTFTVLEDWRLFVSVAGQGGGLMHADQVPAKHTSWSNSLAIQTQDDPIFMGQLAKVRNPLGLLDNGYLALQEVGLQYQLSPALAARMGASRASIAVAARNLGFLWRQEWNTKVGGERIPDIRQSIGNSDFSGQQDSQAPLSSSALIRLRITF
jgi:TonB-linked SusC/RagA family outer membrane protein